MIDLNNLEQYRENNRIEAKTALGGLPKSIWETYSAFANTLGGVILLGVQEHKDKTFHLVDLPDPAGMKREFWKLINDPNTASVNILSSDNIHIENVGGNHIIIIEVPRADRTVRPVYVDGNPRHAYRRNGEGDYRCTEEEYEAMVRDASVRSQDMTVLEETDITVFDPESVHAYREQMRIARPGHILEDPDDTDFLLKLGAAAIGSDGLPHPVIGGLLMFGTSADIVRVFPQYSLEYYTQRTPHGRKENRICSSSGSMSGNVMEFYFRVCAEIKSEMERLPGSDGQLFEAVREAVLNCLVNADYYGQGGIRIIKTPDHIKMANPGFFRMDPEAAKQNGTADPRNSVLRSLFSMINIGGGNGSGIPNIFRIWREHKLPEPEITQETDPDTTVMLLPFLPAGGEKEKKTAKVDQKSMAQIRRRMIIDYLTEHIEATVSELSVYLDLRPPRVKDCLRKLIRDGIVVPMGDEQNRCYKLKS